MTNRTRGPQPGPVSPPSKHQLSLMIWLCVFPTLTVINIALGDWLKTSSPVLRTFVLATIAVPIVMYGLMPYLHHLRVRLMTTRAGGGSARQSRRPTGLRVGVGKECVQRCLAAVVQKHESRRWVTAPQ